ncbi:MAG: DUF177 domain-containing protein [Bacteroidales bacterium]
MKERNNYRIAWKGLKLGRHQFGWSIDQTFFDRSDHFDEWTCHLQVSMEMTREESMMTLDFNIAGTVSTLCDRCGDPLDFSLSVEESYFYKLGAERKEESEQVMIIPETDSFIDVSQLIHDYVILALPLRRIHQDKSLPHNGCNPESITRLESLTPRAKVDHRWDALKNIKLD